MALTFNGYMMGISTIATIMTANIVFALVFITFTVLTLIEILAE